MLYGVLAGVVAGVPVGWWLRKRDEKRRMWRMRREIMKEVRRQDRTKLKAVDRFNADRLMRLADEEFQKRRGE